MGSQDSTHGERVPAYYTHPKDSTDARYPAILLLHGANDFWGKNEDWALDWMDILSREGWCVLVADFYGFGERKNAGQAPSWELSPFWGERRLYSPSRINVGDWITCYRGPKLTRRGLL